MNACMQAHARTEIHSTIISFFFLIYVEACYDEKIMSAECNSVEDGAYVPILVFMEGNE
jgi:hypothetical protein